MASIPLRQSQAVYDFKCLGDRCADTCCKGWGMQLTKETVERYQQDAPELMEAVSTGEAEYIMKRDPETDYCVKFDQGWCSVHRQYGELFLGDACHFFPRVTRRIGDHHLMTASLSCPEIVRLGLIEQKGFDFVDTETDRLPFSMRDVLPDGLDADKALSVHRLFLDAAMNEETTPQRCLAKIRSVAASMEAVDVASWAMAVPFYWKNADARLPIAQEHPADPFNLLNALQGLIGASKKTSRPRLEQTVREMEQALNVTLNWDNLTIQIADDSIAAWQQMQRNWSRGWAAFFQPILARWLQAQLSVACFPFAGLGDSLTDRVTIIGVRFATLRLALMCACEVNGGVLDEDETIRVIQSLARFMDHLADAALSMQIYHETGWSREARLRAIIGDY